MGKNIATALMAAFICFVFIQSLFFKFTGAAEPMYIFSTLEMWAENSVGVMGLFKPDGIFGRYAVGIAELIASVILITGTVACFMNGPKLLRLLQPIGGLFATAIMSGAIAFHLFTPLGIVVESEEAGVASDGGLLFILACLVWIFGLVIVYLRRRLFV